MQYSIVNFKQLEQGVSFRFDAEFFHPRALLFEKRINGLHGKTIKEYGCSVVSGPFGSSLTSDAYLKSGIPFVRISDLRDFIIDTTDLTYISQENHIRLSSSKLKIGDFVLSKVGNTIGVVSIVTPDIGECNISENNLGIRFPKECPIEDRKFILAFLNSEAGQIQILRAISGNAQPKLNVSDAELIRVPTVTPTLMKTISNIIDLAIVLIGKSKQCYAQAEQIFLAELGLLNWKPKHRLSFIKKYSDTGTAGRIDAEYFQPKYDEVVERIKHYKKGYKPLAEIVRVKDKNFLPKDDVAYRYIELANISANGNINGFIEALGNELPTRARRKVNDGDVIVSTIEGSLSSIALIMNDLDNALCSTGFFVVNSERINSETLLVLLKSPVGQLQLKKGCSGTILTAIGDDEFKRIILPDLPAGIQNDIKKQITEMYESKALSKCLLDIAKCGVEMAIEKSEKDAQNWIDAELKKLSVKL